MEKEHRILDPVLDKLRSFFFRWIKLMCRENYSQYQVWFDFRLFFSPAVDRRFRGLLAYSLKFEILLAAPINVHHTGKSATQRFRDVYAAPLSRAFALRFTILNPPGTKRLLNEFSQSKPIHAGFLLRLANRCERGGTFRFPPVPSKLRVLRDVFENTRLCHG